MAAQRATVELFYDVLSPYTWMAFEALLRFEKVWPIELRLRPFNIGAVMKSSGNRPPMMLPAKARLGPLDILRSARYWGIDLRLPSNFADSILKKSSAPVMRFLASIQLHEPDYLIAATRAAWVRLWHDDVPCDSPEHFLEIAKKIHLPRGEYYANNWNNEEAKALVAKNNEEAIEAGAFGAPWIHVTRPGKETEVFFGSDRFHILAEMLDQPFPGPLKHLAAKL